MTTLTCIEESKYNIAWDIPRLLTWRGGLQLQRNILVGYHRWLFARLLLWSHTGDALLFKRVSRLPADSQKRLLLAPEISRLLKSTKAPSLDDRNSLAGYIDREEWLAGADRERQASAGWTALGDKCIGLPPGSWGVPDGLIFQNEYSAPRVFNIVLDAYSPHRNLALVEGERNVSMEPYGEREVRRVQEQLTESIRFISRTNVDTANFICGVTRAIAVGQMRDGKHPLFASSWRGMIGLITLLNCEKAGPVTLADKLIHESVHSVLYALELLTPLYVDADMARDGAAVSPWSGRTLSVMTFAHACCVWFALWSFWSQCSDRDPEIKARRNKSARGFLDGSPLSGLGEKERAALHPDLQIAIEKMAACVRADSVDALGIVCNGQMNEQPA